MAKKRKNSSNSNLLTSPGTLAYVGPEIGLSTIIKRIEYNVRFFRDERINAQDIPFPSASEQAPYVTWLSIDGIHEPKVVGSVGSHYHLHPLILEDIMNTDQKPKLEYYSEEALFLTMKMLRRNPDNEHEILFEHISFTLGRDWLISFQEEYPGDIFSPVEDRIKKSAGKTRSNGPDYLLFALMDVIVDNYFLVLDNVSDRIDRIEDQVIGGTRGESLRDLYSLKRELTGVRRAILPLREMLTQILREDSPLIQAETHPYFRDLYDHVIHIVESIDAARELLASLADVYLTTTSNRMNEVMKTLTIFSAIFMPITFIVGVYGMNFHYMPELNSPIGYYVTWGVMVAISVGMLIYFRWRKWM